MKKSGECKGKFTLGSEIFRVMKMLCFLMFVFLLQVRGEVIARIRLSAVDLKNCNVEEFLRGGQGSDGNSFSCTE